MTIARLRIRLVAALAAVLLLGAACANDGGSDAAASTGSTGTSATGSTGGAGTTASTGSTNGGGGRYDYGSGGGGGGKDDSGTDDSGGAGNQQGNEEITLTADNFAFSPTAIEAKAGSEIYVENANSGTPHTFTVEGTDIDVVLDPGTVQDVDVDLDPGTYAFHCRFHSS